MLVVNLFGGPCSGKSTTMAGLFYKMRLLHMNVEMASEVVKDSVFSGDNYVFKDQLYTFALQQKKLSQLNGVVDIAITDAPLLLSHVYGTRHSDALRSLINDEFDRYNNVNILLDASDIKYNPVGRRKSAESAHDVHEEIADMLLGLRYLYKPVEFMNIKVNENTVDNVFEYVMKKVTT
jgi:predicted ATPase